MEETAADNKCHPANDAHEAQQPEENEEKGKTKTTSESVADKDKELPELTIVLLGDTNSMEIGPNNILLDHKEKSNVDQFSSKLYDMCGRQISVINMIGLQNVAKIPSDQAFHVFLLLVPYGLHCSHYSSGIQWLEKTFGEGFLPYVMTVVTHEPGEKCESALADLKANSGLTEKRFHTCTKNMTDEDEIIALLEKIDIMVSENNPHCYSGLMCDEDKDEDHLQPNKKEDEIRSSGYQHKQK
ncbi:GTPase IMAP family member 8-like, partial [Pundamilia nyererei]|uniref:GTPase IMAP family member 8-like n=1 Tax=Pundamilia nyererei TaxID=303518 RepID=A0A9Y3W145_9CICH